MNISRIKLSILAIPRPLKSLFIMVVDACLCVFAVWIAYYLRVEVLDPMGTL